MPGYDYEAIKAASPNERINVVRSQEHGLTDAEKKQAVQAVDYAVIREAAKNGHLLERN